MKKLFVLFVIACAAWGVSPVCAQTSTAKLSLTWTDRSSNEMGFAVERGTQQAGPFVEIALVAANETAYIDSEVLSATAYCYRVRAWNERMVNSQTEKQYSGYSNVACGGSFPKPDGDPTNLLLSAIEDVGNAQELLGDATAKIARVLRHEE